jgi:DNA-binding IclR family transcriptional regulator
MAETDIESVVRHTQYWATTTHSPVAPDLTDVLRAAESVRRCGSMIDYDRFTAGIGTIAYPLPTTLKATPLALFVSGPSARIKHGETAIRRALELYLASYRAQVLG